jgi:hypothetical protein
VVIIGLAYNKEELCRVFKDTTKEQYDVINYGRKGIINFNDNKISNTQLSNVRNCNNRLHIYLVKMLINKYDLKVTQQYDEVFKKIAECIGVQIHLYNYKKQLIFYTPSNNIYSIHALFKDKCYYVIPNINKFKPESLDISAGKKKEIKLPEVIYDEKEQEENRNRFLERDFTMESISDFITNIVPPPPEYIKSPITSNKIAEWNFILKCVSCNIYYPIYVNNKKEFNDTLFYYFKHHKCTIGKPFNPTSICKECKNYIFKGLEHTCNNSQIACEMYTKNKKFIIRFNKLLSIK